MGAAPCKDCGERRFNCHSMCRKYKDWKAGREIQAEEIAKEKAARPELPRSVVTRIWKERRGRR